MYHYKLTCFQQTTKQLKEKAGYVSPHTNCGLLFPLRNVATAHGMVTPVQQGASSVSPSPDSSHCLLSQEEGRLAATNGQKTNTVLKGLRSCFGWGQESLLKQIFSIALREAWFALWGHLRAHALYFF